MPAVPKASVAAASASGNTRDTCLRSRFSTQANSSKSGTSPAIWTGISEGSKRVMRRIPLFPCKTAPFPTPLGLTVPIPVITTRRFKPHPSTYQDFYQAELSGELPPRSAAHKFLLIQSKYHARPNRKHGLFHREDVLLHPGHVKVVLTLTLLEEFAAERHFGQSGRAFDDHRLVCVLGANPAVLIFSQIPGLA